MRKHSIRTQVILILITNCQIHNIEFDNNKIMIRKVYNTYLPYYVYLCYNISHVIHFEYSTMVIQARNFGRRNYNHIPKMKNMFYHRLQRPGTSRKRYEIQLFILNYIVPTKNSSMTRLLFSQ